MATKSALITGITGQDGSYLAELLLGKGYEVHGIIRRSSSFNTERLDEIYEDPHVESRRLFLHYGDLTDASALVNLLRDIQPDEVYNLGAQSHVKVSFETPEYTGDVSGLGAMRLLEAVRASRIDTRVYQASTSELYGSTPPPQSEQTPFHPARRTVSRSSTRSGRRSTTARRTTCSPSTGSSSTTSRRGEARRSSPARSRARSRGSRPGSRTALPRQPGEHPRLGIRARVRRGDVAHAPGRRARRFVLATGVGATVEQFAEASFRVAGLDHSEYVEVDPSYYRPAEVNYLLGEPAKAEAVLGWKATTHWDELARIMVEADVRLVEDQLAGRQVRVDR